LSSRGVERSFQQLHLSMILDPIHQSAVWTHSGGGGVCQETMSLTVLLLSKDGSCFVI
jgi:hypothetical protein